MTQPVTSSTDGNGNISLAAGLDPSYSARAHSQVWDANTVLAVADAAELRTTLVADADWYLIGTRLYHWNPTSTATDDGVTSIQVTGVTLGRYELVDGEFTDYSASGFLATGSDEWVTVLEIPHGLTGLSQIVTCEVEAAVSLIDTGYVQAIEEVIANPYGYRGGASAVYWAGSSLYVKSSREYTSSSGAQCTFTSGVDAALRVQVRRPTTLSGRSYSVSVKRRIRALTVS